MPTNSQTGAQAVYRAMAVLNSFHESSGAMSVGDIASGCDLTIPTVHRIANALADQGFLVRDGVSRKFGIGPSVLRLAQVALKGESAFSFVEPLIRTLRDEFEETVGLHVRVGGRRVCVRELESPHRVRVVSGVGQEYALSAAAASKAILAFTSPEEIVRLAADDPAIGKPEFRSLLDEIRSRGFATSNGETIPGARAVAAPVLDATGMAIAAINITGPSDRLTVERVNELGESLVARLRDIHQGRYAGIQISGAV